MIVLVVGFVVIAIILILAIANNDGRIDKLEEKIRRIMKEE